MTYLTARDHDESLRLCGLARMGAIALDAADISALSAAAGSYAVNARCDASDARRALALIDRYRDARPTREQALASGGTDAQRMCRLAEAERAMPTEAALAAAGFERGEKVSGWTVWTAADRSRLYVAARELRAAPAK